MDKRTWIIFGVSVIAILTGLVLLSRQDSVDVSSVDHTKIQSTSEQSAVADHVYGNKDAKVVLIEYGDFQCPGCGTFHSNFAPLMKEYEGDIAFVFRNFPLTSIHPSARAAAASAEAAGLQGKYWQMWDLIYENQTAWSSLAVSERDSRFRAYAAQLKLDMDTFNADVQAQKVSQKINFDQSLGKENGVTGTPSLFINGKMIDSEKYSSTEEIRSTLDAALKTAGVTKKDTDKK